MSSRVFFLASSGDAGARARARLFFRPVGSSGSPKNVGEKKHEQEEEGRGGKTGRIPKVSGIGIADGRERAARNPLSLSTAECDASTSRDRAYIYEALRNPRGARYVSAGRKYDLSRGGFRVTLMLRFSPSVSLAPSLAVSLSLALCLNRYIIERGKSCRV